MNSRFEICSNNHEGANIPDFNRTNECRFSINEAYGNTTNDTFRTTNFEEITMHHTKFVVEISLFDNYFLSINEIKYLY